MEIDKKELEKKIIEALKTVYDPEIPVNIYELGLIYEIKIDDEANVEIEMTLTSPSCPSAEELPGEAEAKTKAIEGIKDVKIKLTFDPPWDKDMMSDEAKLELGFM
ncbi:MAG: SUF system Fe-S cluster assembly protein [Bacteroidia bacterium]